MNCRIWNKENVKSWRQFIAMIQKFVLQQKYLIFVQSGIGKVLYFLYSCTDCSPAQKPITITLVAYNGVFVCEQCYAITSIAINSTYTTRQFRSCYYA